MHREKSATLSALQTGPGSVLTETAETAETAAAAGKKGLNPYLFDIVAIATAEPRLETAK